MSLVAQVEEGEGATPAVLHDSPLLRLWHKPSVQFETPNAVVYLHFACPEVPSLNPNPQNRSLPLLFLSAFLYYLAGLGMMWALLPSGPSVFNL